MTTHLVIADQDTIDTITDHADYLASDWDDNAVEGDWWHTETHDTWLFRTPDVALVPTADFYYLESGVFGLPDDPRILPLIAACDLLGIEEL